MLAVNYTNLRDNMEAYMDMVTGEYEAMIITRENNRNIVMMSEESYNNLMESKAQLDKGTFAAHDMIWILDCDLLYMTTA